MTDPTTGAADDTQAMLVDSARQLFASAHRAARIKLNSPRPQPFDAQLWRQMAELGWLSLRLPEDLRGSQRAGAVYCLRPDPVCHLRASGGVRDTRASCQRPAVRR